jgi:hypothetical protein
VSTARRIRRLAIASGLALTLTGSALSATAVAMPDQANILIPPDQAPVVALPDRANVLVPPDQAPVVTPTTLQRPGSLMLPDDAARERRLAVARAQERYYSSYGQPGRPSISRATVATESHDGSWLVIALSILGGIGVAAASATQLRRLRIRRRRAADLRRAPAAAPRLAR